MATRGKPGVSDVVVPIICVRCGVNKRNGDGQLLYVSMHWLKGRRMICPACYETERTLEQLTELVVPWDNDDVPF